MGNSDWNRESGLAVLVGSCIITAIFLIIGGICAYTCDVNTIKDSDTEVTTVETTEIASDKTTETSVYYPHLPIHLWAR